MNYKDQTRHVFPRRMNRQIPTRPRQKVASIHKQKTLDWANPQNRIKYMNLPPAKLDREVIKQRTQMLVHPGKISVDTPDWWKSSLQYFKRTQMPQLHQTIDSIDSCGDKNRAQKSFDVFNRKRDSYMTINNARMESLYNNKPNELSDSRSSRLDSRSSNWSTRMRLNRSEVSPKVGSLDTRDYSIRKPALKIGSNSFVDTYSIF